MSVEYNLTTGSRHKFFPSFFEQIYEPRSQYALNDISLHICKNQRIGLIGPNGAGKTTILKVVAGILRPTHGQISVKGTVGSLFTNIPFINSNISPRENIIQYSEFRGFSHTKQKMLIEELREFMDIGKYFDQPLHFGSAGMQTRFHFGLLTSEPKDILIIDEGIGAGDQFFMEKAERRLDAIYKTASIVILASHSNSLIKKFCERALILQDGKIAFDGDVDHALDRYETFNKR